MTRRLRTNLSTATLFLQEWLHCPRQIGAIVPSSKNLAAAMANWLPAGSEEFVLELGPGTGVVTQALIDRGLRQNRLVAIEKSPKLANLLRMRFPQAHILTGDACQMDELLEEHFGQLKSIGTVISSLPLRNFTPELAHCLAGKIHAILQPAGKWVQFSYHLATKHQREASAFRLLASEVVWWNLPPARVYVYQKPF